jgi:large subunit ribosomal protein L10
MDRFEKESLVQRMRDQLTHASVVVVAQQKGLTVAESTKLRVATRQTGAHLKVLKNTLARLAIRGTRLEGLVDLLKGPTLLAYSDDPVAAPKVLFQFSEKSENVTILGGILDGRLLHKGEVQALAKLPSLLELRAQLVGVLTAPATKIARILKEPAAQLTRVVHARSQCL